MTVMVFGSARGAPGATTVALAVASWLDDAVLVEADPDGGVLALRYGLGREPGLVTLAASRGTGGLLDYAQRLPGGVAVVAAPESASRAGHLWRAGGTGIADSLQRAEHPVVVDAGRLSPTSPALPVVETASWIGIVCRPVAEQLIAAADTVQRLDRSDAAVGLVLVGERPYTSADVTRQLGCLVLGVIDHDPRAAAAMEHDGGSRVLRRSALLRSARSLAETVTGATGPPAASPAPAEQRGALA
jgi:hypothetical protein